MLHILSERKKTKNCAVQSASFSHWIQRIISRCRKNKNGNQNENYLSLVFCVVIPVQLSTALANANNSEPWMYTDRDRETQAYSFWGKTHILNDESGRAYQCSNSHRFIYNFERVLVILIRSFIFCEKNKMLCSKLILMRCLLYLMCVCVCVMCSILIGYKFIDLFFCCELCMHSDIDSGS